MTLKRNLYTYAVQQQITCLKYNSFKGKPNKQNMANFCLQAF